MFHGVSITTIVTGAVGLSNYRFGRQTTVTYPYGGWIATSPLEVIAVNRFRGLHTLVLLDLDPTGQGTGDQKPMKPSDAKRSIELMWDKLDEGLKQSTEPTESPLIASQEFAFKAFLEGEKDNLPIVLCSDMGTPEQKIILTNLGGLENLEGGRLNCLIIPALTSEVEDKSPSSLETGVRIMAENILLFGLILAVFMFFFAGVGLASMRVKEDTTDDYLVAGRGMHPALAALSAVSTWNSGYMFIGFIGFIFLNGYSAIWIAVVSTIGQLVAWIWLYKYIQKQGEERGIRSLSSLVSNTTGSPEAKTAAVLSVLFLSIYAAAQLTAGGVALEVMLNWPPAIGILIGFVLVVAYCYAGGIRASIWTDAAQSCVMIVGSLILCFVAIKGSGGFSGLHNELKIIDPGMVNLFPSGLMFGATLWIAAFFLGGLGVAGQPQVVSRVMTLKDDKARKEAMVWFFVWQTPFIAIMFLIGLACRVLLPELGTSGAETGLPKLAMEQLNPFLGGLILASIFAATMSTADSQVLACTAAITDDVKPEWSQDHKTTKIVTLVVAAFATAISLSDNYFPGSVIRFSRWLFWLCTA